MTYAHRLTLIVVLSLLVFPASALANFAWPPMFYVYTYAVWWVVLAGLLIEGTAYFFAWGRGWRGTVLLTLGLNIASAIAGALFSIGSLLFLVSEVLMIGFIFASPILVFAITVAAEYAAGTHFFSLPRSWRTVGIIAGANVPSVGLAIYEAMELTGKALTGQALNNAIKLTPDKLAGLPRAFVGKMECASPHFVAALETTLRAGIPLLATVMLRPHPVADRVKAHPGVRCLTVTRANRETCFAEALAALQALTCGHSLSNGE